MSTPQTDHMHTPVPGQSDILTDILTDLAQTPPTTVSDAADHLTTTLATALGELANTLLERPATGTAEWVAEQRARQAGEQWALDHTRDWHLMKISIAYEARIEPSGDVINARTYGATWQEIGDQCGMSRQAAFNRWGKYV